MTDMEAYFTYLNMAYKLNQDFDKLVTKHGLLYVKDREDFIPVPTADIIANQFGFVYVEILIRYLEKRNSSFL